MDHDTKTTEASRAYSTAYAAHYTARDLPLAVRLYKELIAAHTGSLEANYSRMQVQNIVNAIVPKQELLDAQMDLVLLQFEHDKDLDTGRTPIVPLVAGMHR